MLYNNTVLVFRFKWTEDLHFHVFAPRLTHGYSDNLFFFGFFFWVVGNAQYPKTGHIPTINCSKAAEHEQTYTCVQASLHTCIVSKLVLWVQSITKDYIRAEHKLYSISKSLSSQVIIPQVTLFEPIIYIPRAFNTGTRVTYFIIHVYTLYAHVYTHKNMHTNRHTNMHTPVYTYWSLPVMGRLPRGQIEVFEMTVPKLRTLKRSCTSNVFDVGKTQYWRKICN